MLEKFKGDVEEDFKAGHIWGVCCTDECGMVSFILVALPQKN